MQKSRTKPRKNVTKAAADAPFKIVEMAIEEEEYVHAPVQKKTTPYMSVYEYSALIATRCLQLEIPGQYPKVETGSFDYVVIATAEVRAGLVNLIIRRTLPDGSTEDLHPKDKFLPRV